MLPGGLRQVIKFRTRNGLSKGPLMNAALAV